MLRHRLSGPALLLAVGLVCLLAFAGINGSYALMVQWPWVLLWQGGFGLVALAMVGFVQTPGRTRAGGGRDRGRDRSFQPLGFGLDLALGITALLILVTSALALQVPPTLGYLVQISGYGVLLYTVTHWLGDRPQDLQGDQDLQDIQDFQGSQESQDPRGFQASLNDPDLQALAELGTGATAGEAGDLAAGTARSLPLGVQNLASYHLPDRDSSDRRWQILQLLGWAGFAATIVGWGAWGAAQDRLAEPVNPYPLGDPDFGAGYLLLLLPLWVVLMGGRGNAWVRSGWAAIVGLGAGLLYTTGSPVGAVGIAALLLAIAALALTGDWFAGSGVMPRRRMPLWGWSFGGLVLWGLAVVSHPRWPGWGNWAVLARDPWSWDTGWKIWQDYPLWGIGLGNLSLVYDAYRPLVATVSDFREVALAGTPLQLAAEMGLVGVGLYLVWLGILGALWLRATVALDRAWELWRRQEADPSFTTPLVFQRTRLQGDRWLCRGCGASLLAYGWGSLLDFQLENLPISVTLVLITALLISLNQSYNGSIVLRVEPWVRRLQQVPLVLLAIWLGLWFPLDGSMALARSGLVALRQGEVEQFYDRWRAAADRVPWDAYYDFQLGAQLTQYVERLNAQGLPEELPADAETIAQEREFREDLLRRARRHLQYAVQKVPGDSLFHRYLGFFLVDLDPRAVAPPLVRALQLSPRQPFLAAQLATAQGYLLPPEPTVEPSAESPAAASADSSANSSANPSVDAGANPSAESQEEISRESNRESNPGSNPDSNPDPNSGPNPDLTSGANPDATSDSSPATVFNPRQDLIQLTLALEGLVHPTYLLNNPAELPELEPLWTGALAQTVDRYDRVLATLVPTDLPYRSLLQNRTILAWWLAQQRQETFEWAGVKPEDFLAFNPRVRSIAAIDQNQPQAALDILQADDSAAAALLRAWIAPERFLPQLFTADRLPPALAAQPDALVRTLQDRRDFPDWLLSLTGETRLQTQGIGFLFYRNTNGPEGVVLPDTVPINYGVEGLELFAPIGESEAFDRVILETQGLLIQNLQGLGLLR
ncbi:MAG: hypothetical protein ACO4CG_04825 [Prochlorothrix sp.]|nr:hypothetical protein [Prochlorothrix sp.]